jgi:hypothetical protein
MRLDADAFDGAEHGDRGCQHAVAVKQREAEDRTEADRALDPAADARRAMRQRGKRQRPAFAVIVGAHDEKDIFERHDDDEGPQHQRHRAHDRDVGLDVTAVDNTVSRSA